MKPHSFQSTQLQFASRVDISLSDARLDTRAALNAHVGVGGSVCEPEVLCLSEFEISVSGMRIYISACSAGGRVAQ